MLYKIISKRSQLFCIYGRKWREVLGIYSVYREYDIYKAYGHKTFDLPYSHKTVDLPYSHKTVDLPYSLPSCYWILIYSIQICSIRLIISVWSWCPDPLKILHMSNCIVISLKYLYSCKLSKSVLLISVNTFFLFILLMPLGCVWFFFIVKMFQQCTRVNWVFSYSL